MYVSCNELRDKHACRFPIGLLLFISSGVYSYTQGADLLLTGLALAFLVGLFLVGTVLFSGRGYTISDGTLKHLRRRRCVFSEDLHDSKLEISKSSISVNERRLPYLVGRSQRLVALLIERSRGTSGR